MASNKAVASAVADVFAAAHATPTQIEVQLYAKALTDIADDELAAGVTRLVAGEKWEFGRRPSPALVLEWVATERAARRAKERPAPPAPPLDPTVAHELMAGVRAARAAGTWVRTIQRGQEQA
jgi:hypothetical protein